MENESDANIAAVKDDYLPAPNIVLQAHMSEIDLDTLFQKTHDHARMLPDEGLRKHHFFVLLHLRPEALPPFCVHFRTLLFDVGGVLGRRLLSTSVSARCTLHRKHCLYTMRLFQHCKGSLKHSISHAKPGNELPSSVILVLDTSHST